MIEQDSPQIGLLKVFVTAQPQRGNGIELSQ